MSREPTRLKDTDSAHPLARELLQSAERTPPMPAASHTRGARRVAHLALFPAVAAGVSLWSKAVAAAFGLGFTSAIALVAVVPAVRDAFGDPGSPPAPPAARSGLRTVQPSEPPAAVTTSLPEAGEKRDSDEGDDASAALPGTEAAEAIARRFSPSDHRFPRRVQDAPLETALPAVEQPLALEALTPPAPVESQPESAREAHEINPALAAEVQLLARARTLAHTDPTGALALLQRHAHEFPSGALSVEREVLVIESLHRSGQRARAAERARRLLSRSPSGLYAARLRALLDAPR